MGKHQRNLTWYVKLTDDTEVKVSGIDNPEGAIEKVRLDMPTSDSPAPVSARPARVYKKKDAPVEDIPAPESDDVPVE